MDVLKLCNVLFATEFNRRYQGTIIRAFAVDTGIVKTDIGTQHMNGLIKAANRLVINRGSDVGKAAEQIYSLVCPQQVLEKQAVYWQGCDPKKNIYLLHTEERRRPYWKHRKP